MMVFTYFVASAEAHGVVGPSLADLEPGWHHFAVVRESTGEVTYYLDGTATAVAASQDQPVDAPAPVRIGRYAFDDADTDLWWRGAAIDDVHISHSARYTATFEPAASVADLDSTLLWKFNEGSGVVASDEVVGVVLDLSGTTWIAGE